MLLTIEGIDAAGKRTQADLLAARARSAGFTATVVSFPRYGETVFSELVGEFLDGAMGTVDALDPRLPATLFALDRLESRALLRRFAARYDLVVLDRYVASNLAYHGARIPPRRRAAFLAWQLQVEFGLFELPKPDLNILLDLPVSLARTLLARKGARSYTRARADLFEREVGLLRRVGAVYGAIARKRMGGRWVRIPCGRSGTIEAPEAIAERIWKVVRPKLVNRRGR